MAKRAATAAAPRPRLSRDRVLRAAVDLADRDGIDGLSMRRLAQELGVEAMSLYYYVANKDDILAGMADLVMSEVDVPAGGHGHDGADWKESIRVSAISFHDALRRHPWVRGVMVSPKGVRPARLRLMEWLLGRLREGGFSPELTYHAYHALDSHITGSTAWEAGYLAFRGDKNLTDLATSFLQELPRDDYPYVAEHIEQHMAGFGRGGKTQFEFGLDLILDGLERMRDTTAGRR